MASALRHIVEREWGLPDVEVARRWHESEPDPGSRALAVRSGLVHAYAAIAENRTRVLAQLLNNPGYAGMKSARLPATTRITKFMQLASYAARMATPDDPNNPDSNQPTERGVGAMECLIDLFLRNDHFSFEDRDCFVTCQLTRNVWYCNALRHTVPHELWKSRRFVAVLSTLSCTNSIRAGIHCVRSMAAMVVANTEHSVRAQCDETKTPVVTAGTLILDVVMIMPAIWEGLSGYEGHAMGVLWELLELDAMAGIPAYHWKLVFETSDSGRSERQMTLMALSKHALVPFSMRNHPIVGPFAWQRFRSRVRLMGRVAIAMRRFREDFYHPETGRFLKQGNEKYRAIMRAPYYAV